MAEIPPETWKLITCKAQTCIHAKAVQVTHHQRDMSYAARRRLALETNAMVQVTTFWGVCMDAASQQNMNTSSHNRSHPGKMEG